MNDARAKPFPPTDADIAHDDLMRWLLSDDMVELVARELAQIDGFRLDTNMDGYLAHADHYRPNARGLLESIVRKQEETT